MISIKVRVDPEDALRKLASRLRKTVSQREMIRKLPTIKFERLVLDYLRSITPVGRGPTYGIRGFSPGDSPLGTTWRSRRDATVSGGIGFTIHSILETIGGARGKAKLYSIELGSMPSVLTKSVASYRFAGDYVNPVIVLKGRVFGTHKFIKRPAREGLNLMGKTSDYIQSTLIGQMREETGAAMKRQLERFLALKRAAG